MSGGLNLRGIVCGALGPVSISLARSADQLLDWRWKSRLKVQHLGPKRRDLNTSHLLVHRALLGLKSIPLVGADTLSRCSEVFGRHAIHYVDGSSTSHEQNMRRESVRINGECHLRICFQCRHFGRVRNRAKHKLNTVPVETYRNRARKSVESEVCQSRRNARLRSEEHTSELQSLAYLVCRLLLEKKKNNNTDT